LQVNLGSSGTGMFKNLGVNTPGGALFSVIHDHRDELSLATGADLSSFSEGLATLSSPISTPEERTNAALQVVWGSATIGIAPATWVMPGEGAGERVLECPGCNICFAPGTRVLMADGTTKSIEDVSAGDFVLSDDPQDDEPAKPEEVAEVYHTETYRLFHIRVGGVDGGEVLSTGAHPFWTQRGWVTAEELEDTDQLRDAAGNLSRIDAIAVESRHTPTFNLDVKNLHTYFVVAGTHSLLVHNQHELSFTVTTASGETRALGNVVSRPMTWFEFVLGFPRSVFAAHTEARLIRTVPLLPGETLTMQGMLKPCTVCRGAMNTLTRTVPGTTAIYTWFDKAGQLQTWMSRGGGKVCP
jgi:hypothetical protein